MTAVTLVILVENSVNQAGLLAEHGFSVWLEVAGQGVLFDTGQTVVARHNAARLNVPLAATRAVVLSHGHYDHTGGLASVLELAPHARIFTHPAAVTAKYARNPGGGGRFIGMAPTHEERLRQAGDKVRWTTAPQEVAPGLWVTGEIPRQNDFEDVGGPFFLDNECTRPDPILDDQALFFDTPQGLVVICGCAHAGVVNTLQHIRRFTGGRPVHAVLGGLHLLQAAPERLAATLACLEGLDIQRLGPAHCTGQAAAVAIWSRFPRRCFACSVGTRFEFELAG